MSSTDGLKKAIKVLETFNHFDRDMQMQQVLAFLYIALENEQGRTANVSLVKDKVDVTSASATRNVQAWADVNRYGKEGFGCIESSINPKNKTEKILTLSKKGKALVSELCRILETTSKV